MFVFFFIYLPNEIINVFPFCILHKKVEEQPRKLDSVIQTSHACLNIEVPADASKDASYQEQAQDLVFNENVLLQTLGFDVAVDHPHTHVVKTCHLVKGLPFFLFWFKKTCYL